MLASEGFRFAGHVDIFDAGPVVESEVADLGAVKASKLVPARIVDAAPAAGIAHLVSNISLTDFRACLVMLPQHGDACTLTPAQAAALMVKNGNDVRVVPLSPKDR